MSYYLNFHTHLGIEEQDDVLALRSLRINEIWEGEEKRRSPYSLGLHPYFENDLREETWQAFKNFFKNYKDWFWAVGECGLDKRSAVPMDIQIDYFIKQIKLAQEVQKPLVLHIVKAWDELLAIQQKTAIKEPCIIHGFRGKKQLAEQLLRAGFYLSFGAYHNKESYLLAESWERAFLETDEVQEIGIKDLYKQCAEYLNIGIEELKERYYQRFLNLGSTIKFE